jgi:hypothetical protein
MRNKFFKKQDFLFLSEQSKYLVVNNSILQQKLKNAYLDKDIIISESSMALSSNVIVFTFFAFYRTSKLIKYRKNTKKKKAPKSLYSLSILTRKLLNNKVSNLVFKIHVLNLLLNKEQLSKLYSLSRKFIPILFSRGLNLFLDFLKVSVLFSKNLISITSYLIILGKIFRVLNKKKHNRFVFFMTVIFDDFVKNTSNDILGIKMIINGKLLGKTRAGTVKIEKGTLKINSIDSNVCFGKCHVYTLYGAFGFKLWVNYK